MCSNSEEAVYTAKFSKSFLDHFIELFNSNRVEDVRGNVIKVSVNYYPNYEIVLNSTIYTEEYYKENTDKILRELKIDKI